MTIQLNEASRQNMVNRMQDGYQDFDGGEANGDITPQSGSGSENSISNDSAGNAEANLLRQVSDAPVISDVFRQIKEAYEMSKRFDRNRWDFSIELNQLLDLGAPTHVVRMLVCDGWLEHQREVASDEGRKFVPESDVVLKTDSCFVLTDKGIAIADKVTESNKKIDRTDEAVSAEGPHWNSDLREYWVGEKLIKRFRWRAANQEKVLEAFAQQGWPHRIDDPLPQDEKICPKQRLHDTIKCLNRKHVSEGVVRFRGDGTGRGVLLVFLESDPGDSSTTSAAPVDPTVPNVS